MTFPAVLIFLSVLLAGVTKTIGASGVGISGRLTYGDIYFAIVLCMLSLYMLKKDSRILFPESMKAFIPLLFVYFLSSVTAFSLNAALIELLVHMFIFAFSLSLCQMYRFYNNIDFVEVALGATIYAVASLAVYGLVILFVFPEYNVVQGGLAGSFRNTGQAGSYFGVFSAIAVAAIFSGVVKKSVLNWIAVALIIIALIFTGKRASLIGFLFGGGLLLLQLIFHAKKPKMKVIALWCLLGAAMMGGIAFVVLLWGVDNVDGLLWRLEAKFTAEGLTKFYSEFWSENISAAIEAFNSRPIMGVGLGNVVGHFHDFEIHSTYLAVAATSGLVGLLAVAFFFFRLTAYISVKNIDNQYQLFLYYFMPFWMGLIISWSYTYSLRKREFWIMIFVLTIVKLQSKQNNRI